MTESRNVVVTGASSGIGAALAKALAGDSFSVYACGRRRENLENVSRCVPRLNTFVCDVSKEEQVRSFVQFIRSHTSRIDALINCAGGFGVIGPVTQVASAAWLHTLEVNLFGTFLMIKHIFPLMKGGHSPRILNFAGGGALSPFPNYSAYAVSKAGVVRLTETLSEELAPSGITVNNVAPGFVVTEIHGATLDAGENMAGEEHYELTLQKMKEGAVSMELVVDCVRCMLGDETRGLTGKTVSASFDPWHSDAFQLHINELNDSDLYTMRRINLVNLEPSPLRKALAATTKRSS